MGFRLQLFKDFFPWTEKKSINYTSLIKRELALNNMLHSEPATIKLQTKEETMRESSNS